MTDNFKRVRECGLTLVPMYTIHSTGMKSESGPMMVYATELESLLEKATVVYLCSPSEAGLHTIHFVEPVDATHTALMLHKRPLVKDSLEQFAKDFIEAGPKDEPNAQYFAVSYEMYERAKALLGLS